MTLKTYVFEFWRSLNGIPLEFYDTVPCNPDQCVFAYTINGYREFTGQTCFESEEPQPYDNRLEFASGVTDWRAGTTPSDGGVIPHSIFRMYKVTGLDVDDENNSYASFKLFDYTYALPSTCYLSYWIYVKESPGGLGHITMDGLLASGTRLKDWTRWGVIIDTSGQVIHPASHTVPQGQWVRCIFSLNPAAGEELKSLSVIYDDGDPTETGLFTAYFDDVQITTEFPVKNIWYAETFANGTDENFRLGLAYTDYEGQPCNGGARIIVDGQGGGGEDWINPAPSLRKDLEPPIPVDRHGGISWRQYDKCQALKLTLFVQSVGYDVHPLIYCKNAPDSWPKPGWVDMGDATQHYDQWEYFNRSISADLDVEYPSLVADNVLGYRLEHFCNEGWEEETGGAVADLAIGLFPWYSFPPVPNPYATYPNSGRKLAVEPGGQNVHVVYDAGGIVKYAISHDGGETWGDPTVIDAGSCPSIALDANGLPTIVYSRDYSTFCKMRRADGTWKELTVFCGDAQHPNGPPSVTRMWAGSPIFPALAYCVLPVYDLNTNSSRVMMVALDTVVPLSTCLAETTGVLADSFVSIACLAGGPLFVAWHRVDHIAYVTIDGFNPPRLEQVPTGGPASHPFIEAYGDRVWVVWRNPLSGNVSEISRPVSGPWDLMVAIVGNGDYPACSKLGTVVCEQPDAVAVDDIWATVLGYPAYDLSESQGVSSEYPSLDVRVEMSGSNPYVHSIYSVWTENVGDGWYSVRFRRRGVVTMGPDGAMAATKPLVLEPMLYDAAPNPSRGPSILRYQVPRSMHVTLEVYDASGRIVRTVLDSKRPAGVYSLTWDGRDQSGRLSPNGIYFCTMKAGDYKAGNKLVISR